MRFKEVIKRSSAAAVAVANVVASVSIANAYTIDGETDNGSVINIFGESNSHFVFAENDAIKQARSFKLKVDILMSGSDELVPAHATLEYGSYSSNGKEVKLGTFVKSEEEFSGELAGTLTADDMAIGKFWLRAPIFHIMITKEQNRQNTLERITRKETLCQFQLPL